MSMHEPLNQSRPEISRAETNNTHEMMLRELGIRKFDTEELINAQTKLVHTIRIGMNRIGEPTTKDGGIPAVPSPVEPITPKDVQAVPLNTAVLAVCWGGSNQISSIARKTEQGIELETLNNEPVSRMNRTHTITSFAELMGEHMLNGAENLTPSERASLQAVGVSLGIPMHNTLEENGIDARPTSKPSNWDLVDLDPSKPAKDQPSLIEPLITYLQKGGLPITNVYFQPDPTAVAHDVPDTDDPDAVFLPVSILAGTGTNAALQNRNLEISSSSDIFPRDEVEREMVKRGYAPEGNATKFRTGGQRIKLRVDAAMQLLAERKEIRDVTAKKITDILHLQHNGPILSQIASGELSWSTFNNEHYAMLSPKEYEILKTASTVALEQAGQVIGVMVASVLHVAGYDGKSRVSVPMAGSIIKQAHGVRKTVEETLSLLFPEHNIHLREASDLRGIAKFAMVQTSKKSS